MIITARQLEDLHKSNGHVVLPYGARLTPLAVDWARSKKIQVGYGPDELFKSQGHQSTLAVSPLPVPQNASQTSTFLWWCDGPCGAAKAAVGALAKESSLSGVDLPADPKQLIPAIKRIATAVNERKSTGAVLILNTGGPATVLANRVPTLRAILGTTFESLESALASVAPNVLIVEYPRKSFSELRNLISRFLRAQRNPSDELARQLKDLASHSPASCGCTGGRH